MKKVCFAVLFMFYLMLSLTSVSAKTSDNKISYRCQLPVQVQNNKTFSATVDINTFGQNMAVGVLVIEYDTNIMNFKGVEFIEKGNGRQIELFNDACKVRVVFVAPNLIKTNEYKSILEFSFTPKTLTDSTNISIYFEQSANIEEEYLEFNNGMSYDIQVSKTSTSSNFSSGRNFSKEEQIEINKSNEQKVTEQTNTTTPTTLVDENENIIIYPDEKESNIFAVFLLGFIACGVVVVIVLMILKYKNSKF